MSIFPTSWDSKKKGLNFMYIQPPPTQEVGGPPGYNLYPAKVIRNMSEDLILEYRKIGIHINETPNNNEEESIPIISSMEDFLKEREKDMNNNIFKKNIEDPIVDTDINIKRIIESQDDIETYTENINDMKNAEKVSPINYKIKMNNTYINNIIFQGIFRPTFLMEYKHPKVQLKYVSTYNSIDNNRNIILLSSKFKFKKNSNYEFNNNIEFIISTDLHEYKYKFNKQCKMIYYNKCNLLEFETKSKKYSGDLVFKYNESNHSISFQSCNIKLCEDTFYSMNLPI